ncbi:MAG: carboxynorspermidine decarboxylase [Clostridia bacterium]
MLDFEKDRLATPYYVVDEGLLKQNLGILQGVQARTGCKILLAQKGYSMYSTYPLIKKYLYGTTASSLYEARLGREEMGGEVHIFSPAYQDDEFAEIIGLCDHIVFNTPEQWQKFRPQIIASKKKVSCGLRVNPEYAEVETELYNPCAPGSRLGTTLANLAGKDLSGLEGLHFHTMCEQNSDTLARTLLEVESKFGYLLPDLKWLNFGGGHHITRKDYDLTTLEACIIRMQEKYDLEIYLEPGEAIALNTGYLVATVLAVMENGIEIVILDTSAACHMPDVLEMPYRPQIIGAGMLAEKAYNYRLAGPTCLAGDIIGDYSFDEPLFAGAKLVFCDMAHYTMVKNNTFNGIKLPSIAYYSEEQGIQLIKEFGYEDFKSRL